MMTSFINKTFLSIIGGGGEAAGTTVLATICANDFIRSFDWKNFHLQRDYQLYLLMLIL